MFSHDVRMYYGEPTPTHSFIWTGIQLYMYTLWRLLTDECLSCLTLAVLNEKRAVKMQLEELIKIMSNKQYCPAVNSWSRKPPSTFIFPQCLLAVL